MSVGLVALILSLAFWNLAHDISTMEQDIKKLCTSSNSMPFRIPWTKFETYIPIDIGQDRF